MESAKLLEYVTAADLSAIADLEASKLEATARSSAARNSAAARESCKQRAYITCTVHELTCALQHGIDDAAEFDQALAMIAAEKEATAAKRVEVMQQHRREELHFGT